MSKVTVAGVQMACNPDRDVNIAKAERFVREAARRGANIVLLSELYEMPYVGQTIRYERYALAESAEQHPTLAKMAQIAAELRVALLVSFIERANNAHYNSIAIIDADGRRLGVYRKSHIPNAPGYFEKYYFAPGDTGFRVWQTCFGVIGVGICWDQWFPEAARAMALMGAELLFYPTAIGTDVDVPGSDSSGPWRRAMQGHAAVNAVPVIAANRIGCERDSDCELVFFGKSFIADHTGAIVADASGDEGVFLAQFDLDAIRIHRDRWHFFRDRRPDLYRPLLTLDGRTLVN